MIDVNGSQHRIFSWAAPHDGTTGSSLSVNIDHIVWRDFSENVAIQWQLTNNLVYLGSRSQDFSLYFENNGSKVAYQRDSEDTKWIALPYIDSDDKLILTGRQQNNTGALASGQSGVLYAWNADEIGNGASLFNITAQSQTNSEFYAFFADGHTNWRIKFGIRNVHPTGIAQADVIASGPAFYRATDFVHDWSFGKNADNDFFLGMGDPGTNTVFHVDKDELNVSFNNPPKLPNYTAATLPSASTLGAGSMVFVQDASGGAVTAFSDGADWRRTTDRTVVS